MADGNNGPAGSEGGTPPDASGGPQVRPETPSSTAGKPKPSLSHIVAVACLGACAAPRQLLRAGARAVVTAVPLLFVLLVGHCGSADGVKLLRPDLLGKSSSAAANPSIALIMGILTKTLVQSSSLTTPTVVGLVAPSEIPLSPGQRRSDDHGAHLGTTVANRLDSIAHIARPEESWRAVAAATGHDFSNILSALMLQPAETAPGYCSTRPRHRQPGQHGPQGGAGADASNVGVDV